MQTFLAYSDFKKSLECLDYRRLGKQRIESKQILSAILNRPTKSGKPYKGWTTHPIVIMWKDYANALKLYHNLCIDEWVKRGYKNTMKHEVIEGEIIMPNWLGHEKFHSSHRSNLLRKNFEYYKVFKWKEESGDPYIWYEKSRGWYTTTKKGA